MLKAANRYQSLSLSNFGIALNLGFSGWYPEVPSEESEKSLIFIILMRSRSTPESRDDLHCS